MSRTLLILGAIACVFVLLSACKREHAEPAENLPLDYYSDTAANFLPVQDICAAYSNDGSKIVFYRMAKTDEYLSQQGIYIMNSDGSGLKSLFVSSNSRISDVDPAFKFSFSRDGKDILSGGIYGAWTLNIDSKIFRVVAPKGPISAGGLGGTTMGGTCDWASDNKKVAFEINDGWLLYGGDQIGLFDTASTAGDFEVLTPDLAPTTLGWCYGPVFNGACTDIYYAYRTNNGSKNPYDIRQVYQLKKINISTKMPITIIADSYSEIKFLTCSRTTGQLLYNIKDFNMILRDSTGQLIRRIPKRGLSPNFHPDGDHIIFSSPDSAGVGLRLATYSLSTGAFKMLRYY
jgi:hypothetical protein